MRCAIYCRLSREDEEKSTESESILNQKNLLTDYVTSQHWELVELYWDEDYSGADRLRPDFQRLLQDARAGRFDIILCKTQSRFTRDMELVERYLHGLFPLWGIRFIALADHVDTALVGNKKARQINGLVNEWYLEDLSENIRMVLNHKRRQGDYIGGFPLYGYQLHPQIKGQIIPDEEAATVVRRIFQLAKAGLGHQKIANLLNDEGIPNPASYKQQKGLTYVNGQNRDGRGLWNRSSIGRILQNEMYLGIMIQGRRKKLSYKSSKLINMPPDAWFRVEGTHEALVDTDTFATVRSLHAKRRKSDGSGMAHPLAGLVFCHHCGAGLHKNSYQYRGQLRSYLRCVNPNCPLRLAGTSACALRLDRLLQALESRLNDYVARWQPKIPVSTSPGTREVSHGEGARTNLEQQIFRHRKALEHLYLDKVSGLVSSEQFRLLADGLENHLSHCQKALASLKPSPQRPEPTGTPSSLLNPGLLWSLVQKIQIEVAEDSGQQVHIFWHF